VSVSRARWSGVAVALAVGVAACGGAPTTDVQQAPSAGASAPATKALVADASGQPRTPKLPSPLAKEPVIAVPRGPVPTRLVVKDLVTGHGDAAQPHDNVTVNYVGVLYRQGRVFDSSWQRRQTFTTALSNGSVISGWVKGIVGERVGGRRELIIPPNLAYGSAGSPPKVPPGATLVFDVDLLSVSDGGDDG
jgi:peptidylprolyl isomerase